MTFGRTSELNIIVGWLLSEAYNFALKFFIAKFQTIEYITKKNI